MAECQDCESLVWYLIDDRPAVAVVDCPFTHVEGDDELSASIIEIRSS